jgi:SH3-like domain-containing protein
MVRQRMAGRRTIAVHFLAALILAFTAWLAPAGAADNDTGLKVPRFVSLRADKVNLRTGPGRRYPIEWVLTKKDMPVEVIAQFEHWRRIRDWEGTVGWVQEHMVAGKRHVVVGKGGDRPLHQQPDPASAVMARAEAGVIARLAECRGTWCRVETDAVSGWLRRTDIWGVYPDEKVP